ncbi:MAG: hypothetical protein JXA78_06575 [Anaerolineales bacterium]|nr:hypothetical protein [Anaerolineales bacterium]
MRRRSGCNLILGLALILLGGWFLAVQFFPALNEWIDIDFTWPLIIVGVGVFLLLFGLAFNAPGMAVPACIVGGIGGLLYWQNATGNWESWAYAWALIPGFVGVGVILAGVLEGRLRQALSGGGMLVVISLVLFSIFASFLGGPRLFGMYWPVLLILLGLWMLLRAVLRR